MVNIQTDNNKEANRISNITTNTLMNKSDERPNMIRKQSNRKYDSLVSEESLITENNTSNTVANSPLSCNPNNLSKTEPYIEHEHSWRPFWAKDLILQ